MELKFSMGGGHPLPYPPPVSAAPTQKAQAPSSVSRLNGYLNRLNFFLATSLDWASKISEIAKNHLNNDEKVIPPSQPNHDKLIKVQPFLDAVIKAFHKEYCPTQNLSIDEAMVAFKGQLKLNMKQYVPLEMIIRCIKANDTSLSQEIV